MISEEELVYNIKLGRREALESLFFVYEKKMKPIVKKYEYLFNRIAYSSEDIKVVMYNALLQTLKYYLPSNGEFYSFSRVVLIRSIIAIFRDYSDSIEINSFNVSNYFDDYSFEDFVVSNDNILEDTTSKDTLSLLDTLSPIEKRVMLYYISGYSYEEISKFCNLGIKKVGNKIQRAREKLRKIITEDQ